MSARMNEAERLEASATQLEAEANALRSPRSWPSYDAVQKRRAAEILRRRAEELRRRDQVKGGIE